MMHKPRGRHYRFDEPMAAAAEGLHYTGLHLRPIAEIFPSAAGADDVGADSLLMNLPFPLRMRRPASLYVY